MLSRQIVRARLVRCKQTERNRVSHAFHAKIKVKSVDWTNLSIICGSCGKHANLLIYCKVVAWFADALVEP